MSRLKYAELHSHSAFSFLDGAAQPEELVAEAARLGLSALAITDHNGLYGVVRHAQAAADHGLPAVFGAELTLTDSLLAAAALPPGFSSAAARPSAGVTFARTGIPDPDVEHLLVLARGAEGYRKLSRAIALAHLASGAKGEVHFTLPDLGEHAGGEWLVLAGCRKSGVRRALAQGDFPGAAGELAKLIRLFGADNVALELPVCSSPADGSLPTALAELAEQAGVPLVATTAAHYAHPQQAHLAGALSAIRANSSLAELDGYLPAPTAHLRSPAEVAQLCAHYPQAVAAAARLGAECAFDLRLVAPNLPPYPVPPRHTEATWLRELVARGGTRRYGARETPEAAKAWEILDHELEVIEHLGFPGYFLVVYDLVQFCRSRGILCQGRGSAANSAVCYALGITAVDAVKHGLLFERFLSPERDGPPDIDLDIESIRREEVIQHVYHKFGRTYAAQVANVISYRPRSAVRDAAKALGYDVGQQDAWSKGIERWGSIRADPHAAQPGVNHGLVLSEASGQVEPVYRVPVAPPALWEDGAELVPKQPQPSQFLSSDVSSVGATRSDPMAGASRPGQNVRVKAENTPRIPEPVVALAEQMLKLPRHLGIHSGGMVMCDRPVIEVCPVQWAAMEGRTVLQWDKEDCADAGLVKFDLLGLGMLTAIRYAFESIAEREGKQLELHTLPEDDPAVYDLLCAADTVGVFQVESRAQMATLPRLKPRNFYDLVVEVALIRPGPIQGNSVHPYLNRRNGKEEVSYLHPLLEKSLSRTLGIPIFQEQLMQMAIDVAGFSPAESDQLRRAMGSKRSVERMEALRERLMSGMAENGVPELAQMEIFEKLKGFADFGFPESHAYSFAFLVYSSAWLKVHYPAEFYAGLLAAQPMGFYSPQSLCADARRHGVTVLRPCLNLSVALASAEKLGAEVELPPEHLPLPRSPDLSFGGKPDLRIAVREGLAQVHGLGLAKAKEIVKERLANGRFTDAADLVRRIKLTTPQLEALATAGAMDTFDLDRRAGIWAAEALAHDSPQMLPLPAVGAEAPALPAMSVVEAVVADAVSTSITPEYAPIEFVRDRLAADGVLTVSQALGRDTGNRVAVGGAVTHRQRPGTAGGVTFISLEDETGLLNVVCQQKIWENNRQVARRAKAMVIRGRIEKADGATNLVAEHLAPLRLPVLSGSRDFR